FSFFYFFQAEDGLRDGHMTGVQTCALPISAVRLRRRPRLARVGKARQASTRISRASTDLPYFRAFGGREDESLRLDAAAERRILVSHDPTDQSHPRCHVEPRPLTRGIVTEHDTPVAAPSRDLELAYDSGLEIHPHALSVDRANEIERRPVGVGRQDLGATEIPWWRRASCQHTHQIFRLQREAQHA